MQQKSVSIPVVLWLMSGIVLVLAMIIIGDIITLVLAVPLTLCVLHQLVAVLLFCLAVLSVHQLNGAMLINLIDRKGIATSLSYQYL